MLYHVIYESDAIAQGPTRQGLSRIILLILEKVNSGKRCNASSSLDILSCLHRFCSVLRSISSLFLILLDLAIDWRS